jgi:hypothetical protein
MDEWGDPAAPQHADWTFNRDWIHRDSNLPISKAYPASTLFLASPALFHRNTCAFDLCSFFVTRSERFDLWLVYSIHQLSPLLLISTSSDKLVSFLEFSTPSIGLVLVSRYCPSSVQREPIERTRVFTSKSYTMRLVSMQHLDISIPSVSTMANQILMIRPLPSLPPSS